ncbi:hypothetical protein BST61_g8217 [Cercospora zeina]
MYRANGATKPKVLCVRTKRPTAPPSEAGSDTSEKIVVPEDHNPFFQEGPAAEVEPQEDSYSFTPRQWAAMQEYVPERRQRAPTSASWTSVVGYKKKQEGSVFHNEDEHDEDGSTTDQDASEGEEAAARDKVSDGEDDDTDGDVTISRDEDEHGNDPSELESEDEEDGQYEMSESNDSFLTEEYRGRIYINANQRNKARKLNEIKAASGKYAEDYLDRKMHPRWTTYQSKGHAMPETAWHLRTIDALADLAAICPNSDKATQFLAAEMKKRRYRKKPTEVVQPEQIQRVCRKLRDH